MLCASSKYKYLCGNQIYGVHLHAIDATPARRRGGAGFSPLDGARAAVSSPRDDFVNNYRASDALVDFHTASHHRGSKVFCFVVDWALSSVPETVSVQRGSEEPPLDLWANEPVKRRVDGVEEGVTRCRVASTASTRPHESRVGPAETLPTRRRSPVDTPAGARTSGVGTGRRRNT